MRLATPCAGISLTHLRQAYSMSREWLLNYNSLGVQYGNASDGGLIVVCGARITRPTRKAKAFDWSVEKVARAEASVVAAGLWRLLERERCSLLEECSRAARLSAPDLLTGRLLSLSSSEIVAPTDCPVARPRVVVHWALRRSESKRKKRGKDKGTRRREDRQHKQP